MHLMNFAYKYVMCKKPLKIRQLVEVNCCEIFRSVGEKSFGTLIKKQKIEKLVSHIHISLGKIRKKKITFHI